MDVAVTHSTSHYHVLVTHFTPCFVTSLHHIAHNSHILLHCSHIICRIMCTMWCAMRCGFVIWNGAWCGVVWYGMRYGMCYSVTVPCFATSQQHNSTSNCTTFHIAPHLFMQHSTHHALPHCTTTYCTPCEMWCAVSCILWYGMGMWNVVWCNMECVTMIPHHALPQHTTTYYTTQLLISTLHHTTAA